MGIKLKLPKLNTKNFPYQLVMCYWEDTVSDASWIDIIDIKKAKLVEGECYSIRAERNSGNMKIFPQMKTISTEIKFESPLSTIFTFFSICLKITSMCLSFSCTPCNL